MKKFIRKWIKELFDLYDIDDLSVGAHCGCCGKWVDNDIVEKNWKITICDKCLNIEIQ